MKTRNGVLPIKLFAVVLAGTCLPLGLQAQDYEYTISDGQVTITEYIGEGGEVVIPAEIEGFPVTSIGDRAFERCGLTSVTIPDSVILIGKEAFRWCFRLTEFQVAEGNLYYTSLDGVLCDKAVETLLQFPGGRTGEYVIHDSVITISDWAFGGCDGLTSVTIPDSVCVIKDYAFGYCDLASLTIPASVNFLGEGALYIGYPRPASVYFLGNPPVVDSFGGPFWDKAMYWVGQVFFIEGTPGWAAASSDDYHYWPYRNIYAVDDQGQPSDEAFLPFDPDWLWGPYEYLEETQGIYVNTGAWLGWLEVTYSPWVWHLDTGCCLYIEEPVAAAGCGWIYVPDLATDSAPLWLEMEPGTAYGWSYGLNKWLYVVPGGIEAGSGWVYLADW